MEHPDLSVTTMYNVRQAILSGRRLTEAEQRSKDAGLVVALIDLHDQIDQLVAEAYGWPTTITDQEIVQRLIALNAERASEEAAGTVQWLRRDFQIGHSEVPAPLRTGELDLGDQVVAIDTSLPDFPKDRYEQPLAVKAVLAASSAAMDATAISRVFKGPARARVQRVEAVLRVLALYGDVMALPDGKFAARRAA